MLNQLSCNAHVCLKECVRVFPKHLGEDSFQHIDYDGIPKHLIHLTIGYPGIAHLVDIAIGNSHQTTAFSRR